MRIVMWVVGTIGLLTSVANVARGQSLQVTGGTVSAKARVGTVEGLSNEQTSTALLPNPGNGQLQTATKTLDSESMTVTSQLTITDCLAHGIVTLDYLANSPQVGPSQGIGAITMGLRVSKTDWYYLDTYLSESQLEDAEIRIVTDPTQLNQTTVLRQRDGVADWQRDKLINLEAGTQYILVGNLSLIVPEGQLNPLASSEDLEFNLRCLPAVRPILSPDLNRDGTVDAEDARLLFEEWGPYDNPIGSLAAQYDLNLDLQIDTADAGILFAAWTGDVTKSVPEPTGLTLMSGLLWFVRRHVRVPVTGACRRLPGRA